MTAPHQTAHLFVSNPMSKSVGSIRVGGFETVQSFQERLDSQFRCHGLGRPHSGGIATQLEAKNKKPGMSWVKLAKNSYKKTGS